MKARTVVADYRGNVLRKCRGFLLLHHEYDSFRLPRKRAVQMPWSTTTAPRLLPWFSLTAEDCRTNAVISDYCTATAVVFDYRGSVPCKCRNRK